MALLRYPPPKKKINIGFKTEPVCKQFYIHVSDAFVNTVFDKFDFKIR